MIGAIRAYRLGARITGFNRNCLFDVSCSRHVEAIAREQGALAAIRAMRARFANCRPGYSFEFGEHSWRVECVAGMRLEQAQASVHLHREAALLQSVLQRQGPAAPD